MSTPSKAKADDPVRTAVRFPLHLDVLIHWDEGDIQAVTEDVSSNGILFIADNPPPVDTRVDFRMTMPAAVMGSAEDVTLRCIGRIVRHMQTAGGNMAAAVIDEYSLKAEHQ